MRRMLLQRGFTLVELVVTLVVASILLAVAVPSFTAMIKNNRLVTSANAMVAAANIARSEAIKRGVRVTVCKSDPANDPRVCTTANDWEQGWIVFTDTDSDATVDAGETLIRVHEALPGNDITMVGSGNGTDDYLSFIATGRSQMVDGVTSQSGTITLCDDRGATKAVARVISNTGRVRQAVDSNGDGIVEDFDGDNVTCP